METLSDKLNHTLKIMLIVTLFIWAMVGFQEIFLNSDRLDKLGHALFRTKGD